MATYSTLQAAEPITQTAEVIVKTTLLSQEWVKDLAHIAKTRVAQVQMVACWVAYLGQHSSLSSLPLKEELQKTLGPVTYPSDALQEVSIIPPEKSPLQKGKYLIPEKASYMDEPSR